MPINDKLMYYNYILWKEPKYELPENAYRNPVIVVVEDKKGKFSWMRAFWVEHHSVDCTGSDYDGDDIVYDEKEDEYYWPEGWYEFNEREEMHWRIEEKVVFWGAVTLPGANLAG